MIANTELHERKISQEVSQTCLRRYFLRGNLRDANEHSLILSRQPKHHRWITGIRGSLPAISESSVLFNQVLE